MKRRNFIGFLGGAAAAGPRMVKQAAAQTMADLSVDVGGCAGAYVGEPSWMTSGGLPINGQSMWDAAAELVKVRRHLQSFMGKTAAQRRQEAMRLHVSSLDPDIASLRSVSLGAKVAMQRDRLYERQQAEERGWIERRIADLLGETA